MAASGVWVKGNSNDGRIRFEIEDAEPLHRALHLFTPLGFDLSKPIETPLRLKDLGGVYR